MAKDRKTPEKRKKRRRKPRRQSVEWRSEETETSQPDPTELPAGALPAGFAEADTDPDVPAVRQTDLFDTRDETESETPPDTGDSTPGQPEAPEPSETTAGTPDWETAKTEVLPAVAGDEPPAPPEPDRPVPPEADARPRTRDFGPPIIEPPPEAVAPKPKEGAAPAPDRRGLWRSIRLVVLAALNLVVTTLLVFGLVGAASYFVLKHYIGGKEVKAPNLLRMSSSEALEKASQAGLVLKFERRQYHESIPRGDVVAQSPPPDVKVKTGTPIRVVLSDGAARGRAPSVVGLTEINAGVALRAETEYDLDVGDRAEVFSRQAEKGIVVGQDPPPGTPISRGGRIHLLVSKGPPPTYYEMPDLRGQTVQEARIALGALRLSITELREADRPGTRRGIVIEQQPAPGRRVARGDRIVVTTASGLESGAPRELPGDV